MFAYVLVCASDVSLVLEVVERASLQQTIDSDDGRNFQLISVRVDKSVGDKTRRFCCFGWLTISRAGLIHGRFVTEMWESANTKIAL